MADTGAKPAGYKIIRVPLRASIRVSVMEFSWRVLRARHVLRATLIDSRESKGDQRARACYAPRCESRWISQRVRP